MMEKKELITSAETSHWGAVRVLWLHFLGALMSFYPTMQTLLVPTVLTIGNNCKPIWSQTPTHLTREPPAVGFARRGTCKLFGLHKAGGPACRLNWAEQANFFNQAPLWKNRFEIPRSRFCAGLLPALYAVCRTFLAALLFHASVVPLGFPSFHWRLLADVKCSLLPFLAGVCKSACLRSVRGIKAETMASICYLCLAA